MSVFSQEQLAKIVAETIPADAKPNEKFLIGTVDQTGAKVMAVLKLKDEWEVQAVAEANWKGSKSAGAKVMKRWL